MQTHRRRRLHPARIIASLSAALPLASLPASSLAQPPDDHGVATALIAPVERDAATASVAAAAIANTKAALERSARFRAAGDEAHAKAADGLALEWAQVARDLAKAASVETSAADVRRKAVDAQAQLERTRAQVEEGIARVGRLQAELAETERTRVDRLAVEMHDGDERRRTDGASHKTPRQAPKASGPAKAPAANAPAPAKAPAAPAKAPGGAP
jgi:hypothetical protein